MWDLKIVADGQTDSLTNLIKCVVIYRSYSYAFWSTSLWAPDCTYTVQCTCVISWLPLQYGEIAKDLCKLNNEATSTCSNCSYHCTVVTIVHILYMYMCN